MIEFGRICESGETGETYHFTRWVGHGWKEDIESDLEMRRFRNDLEKCVGHGGRRRRGRSQKKLFNGLVEVLLWWRDVHLALFSFQLDG